MTRVQTEAKTMKLSEEGVEPRDATGGVGEVSSGGSCFFWDSGKGRVGRGDGLWAVSPRIMMAKRACTARSAMSIMSSRAIA